MAHIKKYGIYKIECTGYIICRPNKKQLKTLLRALKYM